MYLCLVFMYVLLCKAARLVNLLVSYIVPHAGTCPAHIWLTMSWKALNNYCH